MTTVLASRINAGKRPAQRTMDRLARSSIPDERITITADFKLIEGREQYWRHVAKNISHIQVYTPADMDRERSEKLAKMQAVIKEDLENEIATHQKAIADLKQKIQANEPYTVVKMVRIPVEHKITEAEIETIILTRPVDIAARMTGMCEDAVEHHKKRLEAKRALARFANEAPNTGAYVKLCEQGHHAENHGQPWDRLDVEKLRLALRHDADIVECSKRLGRTPFALLCKAIQQGFLDEKNAYRVMRSIVK